MLQFGHELFRGFVPGFAAIEGHHVAEFTVEGTAAARLHRQGGVPGQIQKVPARNRGEGKIGKSRRLVERGRSSGIQVGNQRGGQFLRLAHHHMVDTQVVVEVRA